MTRRPLAAPAAAVLGALLLAGCGGGDHGAPGTIVGLTVSGRPGTAPVVRIATPLRVTRDRSEVVVEGTGPVLGPDQVFVTDTVWYDARTGAKMLSTFAAGKGPEVVRSSDMQPEIAAALVGRRQGSRVAMTFRNGRNRVVMVYDIVAVPPATTLDLATGTPARLPRDAEADLPRVVLRDGLPHRLQFPAGAPPARPQVVTLIAGDGPRVRDESLVTIRRLAQRWGDPLPFEDSFAKEPVLAAVGLPVPATVGIPGVDGLVGVRRGSRLLLVQPARGTSPASSSVIDVVGVS